MSKCFIHLVFDDVEEIYQYANLLEVCVPPIIIRDC